MTPAVKAENRRGINKQIKTLCNQFVLHIKYVIKLHGSRTLNALTYIINHLHVSVALGPSSECYYKNTDKI